MEKWRGKDHRRTVWCVSPHTASHCLPRLTFFSLSPLLTRITSGTQGALCLTQVFASSLFFFFFLFSCPDNRQRK